MRRNLHAYLDLAIEKNGLQSNNHLAKVLEVSSAYISNLRQGKSLPSPELMVKLAKLAGIPAQEAILELGEWSTDGEAREAYQKLIDRLKVTAAAAMLCAMSLPSNAIAAPAHLPIMTDGVYYGKR